MSRVLRRPLARELVDSSTQTVAAERHGNDRAGVEIGPDRQGCSLTRQGPMVDWDEHSSVFVAQVKFKTLVWFPLTLRQCYATVTHGKLDNEIHQMKRSHIPNHKIFLTEDPKTAARSNRHGGGCTKAPEQSILLATRI